MDIATIVGIISGLAFIVVSMMLGTAGLLAYYNLPSIMITVGGSIASLLINYNLRDVVGVIGTVRNAFTAEIQAPGVMIETLVSYATKARREGILTLESELEAARDPFLVRGVRLAIDGTAPELIKDILTTELMYVESRHTLGQGILTMWGTYAPAYGMIGTLIGLIAMLRSMDDPTQIGPGMATAIITTFYGAIIANLVALPLAGKLRTRTQDEMLVKEMIIEGILSIQSGDNPRIVEHKLKAFIAPRVRENIQTSLKTVR